MANNPTLLTMPIAENGQKNTIPATQAAAGDGLLSQSTGFPPETALPLGAGGKAPTREDFNGALNLLSNIAFYSQKGWTFQYDENQAYYKGCIVMDATDGLRYECINDVAAGTILPSADTDNDYWREYSPGGVPLGTILPYSGTGDTPPYGFLFFEGQAVSRTMYADYFDLVGTTYGEGDGENTFNLPNLIDAAMLNGSYTKTSYETAGSATFTAPKTGWYKITAKGGGGGGAGGQVFSSYFMISGGAGGEGGLSIGYEKMTAGDTATVVIGAGGTGGAKANNGSNGGDTTVSINLSVYTGGGGQGGIASNAGGDGGKGGSGQIPGNAGECGSVFWVNAVGGATGAYTSGGGAGGGVSSASATSGGGGAGGRGQRGTSNADISAAGFKGGDGYATFEYIGISMKYIGKVYDAPTPSSAQIDLSQYASDLARRLTREQTPAFNKRDVITVSGTYTAPVTGWYRIVVKGGGGGGAGASGNGVSGGGGGEGGTAIAFEKMTAGDTASVVVGAGGTGGAVSGLGTNGGNSTVTVNNNTYTGGGGHAPAQTGRMAGAGGSGTIPGNPGGSGAATTNGAVPGGSGGGKGGAVSLYGSMGLAGTNGGGGAGGMANASTNYAGSAGGDGYAEFSYFDPSLM